MAKVWTQGTGLWAREWTVLWVNRKTFPSMLVGRGGQLFSQLSLMSFLPSRSRLWETNKFR